MKTLEEAIAAIDKMKADHEAEKAAILTKNKELIEREKTAKAKADAAEAAAEEAATNAEREAKDVEAIEKRLTQNFQKQIDTLTKDRDTANASLRTITVDNEITKALAASNVHDYAIESLSYQFKAQAEFKDGTGTIDGKPISDFISEWCSSEKGANFRRVADNSGAGATGNTSTVAIVSHGFTKENFKQREAEWIALATTDAAKAKQAALDAGRDDLAATL